MALRSTLAVVTLLGLVQWTSTGLVFRRHANSRLQDGCVTHKGVYGIPCRCRTICFDDPTCTGYTLEPYIEKQHAELEYLCSFAAGNLTQKNLTAVEEGERVVTHLKVHACPFPFTDVPDAGCSFISTARVTQSQAASSCPAGSHLFTPDLNKKSLYWTFAEYLDGTNLEHLWTSLTKDGSSFSSPSGSIISGEQGIELWATGEPDDPNEKCIVMTHGKGYRLADVFCHPTQLFVCQKH